MKTERKITDKGNLENRAGKIPVNTFVGLRSKDFRLRRIK